MLNEIDCDTFHLKIEIKGNRFEIQKPYFNPQVLTAALPIHPEIIRALSLWFLGIHAVQISLQRVYKITHQCNIIYKNIGIFFF